MATSDVSKLAVRVKRGLFEDEDEDADNEKASSNSNMLQLCNAVGKTCPTVVSKKVDCKITSSAPVGTNVNIYSLDYLRTL